MNNQTQVLCFGEILWDNLPTGPLPGGAPMNVALHLKRFGIGSKIASSIGNDQKGAGLITFLKNAGMDTSYVQTHTNLPTSEVLVHLNEKNNATFEICEPVAWDEIQLTPELAAALKNSQALVYGSLASRNETTRKTLGSLLESNILRIMDVNLRPPFHKQEVVVPLLKKADIVKLNDDELVTICGWFNIDGDFNSLAFGLYNLLKLKTLIVTRGEHGATLINDDKMYSHPGYKVKVADTVGAGDAFLAGYLAAFFDGKEMDEALADASAIGAYVASKPGAVPDYDKETLKKFGAAYL
jgi:fructokinase